MVNTPLVPNTSVRVLPTLACLDKIGRGLSIGRVSARSLGVDGVSGCGRGASTPPLAWFAAFLLSKWFLRRVFWSMCVIWREVVECD